MRHRALLCVAGIVAFLPLAGCVVYDDGPYYGRSAYYYDHPPPARWSYSENRWAPSRWDSRWDDRYRRGYYDRP